MIVCGKPVVEWVCRRIKMVPRDEFTAIGYMSGDVIRCAIIYESYNESSIVAHIACDEPCTRSFLKALFDYPFNQLGVKKMIAPVSGSNLPAVNFVTKLGFTEEARVKDVHPVRGDLVFFTLKREQCRWIGANHG